MTAYRRRFYRITASALVGAVGITGISTTASMASTSSSTSIVAVSTAAPGSSGTTSGGVLGVGVSAFVGTPGADVSGASTATYGVVGIILKGVVKAIKSVPGLWNTAVAKVRAGYQAFQTWWKSSVPQWIKTLLAGVTLYDLYEFVRDLLGI